MEEGSSKNLSGNSATRRGTKIQIGGGLSVTQNINSNTIENSQQDAIQSSSTNKNKLKTLYELCDTTNLRARKRSRTETAPSTSTGDNLNKGLSSRRVIGNRSQQNKRVTPQVEIVNGQIIIKESSLLLEEDVNVDETEYEEVNEGGFPTASYTSFLDRPKQQAWGLEETRRFYQALRQCGTDFSLMQAFFPERTRRHLKLKFFREERQFPELVKTILDAKIPLELTPFEAHFGDVFQNGNSNSSDPSSGHPNQTDNKDNNSATIGVVDDDE